MTAYTVGHVVFVAKKQLLYTLKTYMFAKKNL